MILIPLAGCTGPPGEGATTITIFSPRQIIVTWSPFDESFFFGPLSERTTVEAYPGQEIRIKGSGWIPRIVLTICYQDLDLAMVKANECGDLEVLVTILPSPPLEMEPLSVKAWVLTADGYVPEAT